MRPRIARMILAVHAAAASAVHAAAASAVLAVAVSGVLADDGAADRAGMIVGRVDAAAGAHAVEAIDRQAQQRYPGTLDADGAFRVAGLPVGKSYDLAIDYQQARLEGVDLRVPPSDYEANQPLTDEDRQELRERVERLNRFEDVLEFLAIEGNAQHAAVLVNKLRTRPFFDSRPGEVIWRAEIWRFTRPDDHWVKTDDELFVVLYRKRFSRQEYDQQAITFDPRLGGLEPTAEAPVVDLGRVALCAPQPGIRLAAERAPDTKELTP